MLSTDVLIAGGGVAGLLLASELASHCRTVVVERDAAVATGKYWLTDGGAARANPELESFIERRFDSLDYVAYDGLRASVRGDYALWDTSALTTYLRDTATSRGARLLLNQRFYSFTPGTGGIIARVNDQAIHAKLLIDCMGFGSPIVGAKGISTILGYYVVHGREVRTTGEVPAIALDNLMISGAPAFFELFPTSRNTAHAALIVPSRHHKTDAPLHADLNFILSHSHYAKYFVQDRKSAVNNYFGIVPVGRLHTCALNHILFFGEAGQSNPAAAATALSRMLRVYKPLAASLVLAVQSGALQQRELVRAMPRSMSPMNRAFQEVLYESILEFSSDGFRRLVSDLQHYPDEVVNDFIFADFDFRPGRLLRLGLDSFAQPGRVLGSHLVKAALRRFGSAVTAARHRILP